MRILHINEHLEWTGGIETYLLSVIPELERLGHEQFVAYSKGDGSLVEESYHFPGLSKPGPAAERETYNQVAELLGRIRPDVAHVHQTHNVGAVRACLERVSTVLSTHDYRFACPSSTFFQRRPAEICPRRCGPACFTTTLTKRCMTVRPLTALRHYRRVRWFQANADRFARVIAVSGYAGERYLQAGVPSGKIAVIPYFCPLEAADAPCTPPETPTVMFIGRVRPVKGYEYLVRALERLPDVRAILIGDWTDGRKRDLEDLCESLNCGGRVEVRPWVNRADLGKTLREATVFAFPSIWAETLGIAGLEAQATGVPVVASDVGGVREWVQDGETGILVPPKDVDALAAAIRTIVESPRLGEELARNALSMIRERFGLERHMESLLRVYHESVDGAGCEARVLASVD